MLPGNPLWDPSLDQFRNAPKMSAHWSWELGWQIESAHGGGGECAEGFGSTPTFSAF